MAAASWAILRFEAVRVLQERSLATVLDACWRRRAASRCCPIPPRARPHWAVMGSLPAAEVHSRSVAVLGADWSQVAELISGRIRHNPAESLSVIEDAQGLIEHAKA